MIFAALMVKDYYKILEIQPTANSAEIKAAYRKLALQFHPDKNPGNKYALSQFYLVKEAYETLSSEGLKEEYLNQRWLSKVNNKKFESAAVTPETILLKFLKTSKELQQLDAFRADKPTIESEILSLCDANTVSLLNDFDDTQINDQIVTITVEMSTILPPARREKIFAEIKKISVSRDTSQLILQAEKDNKLYKLFNRLKPFLIALAVLFLCVLILIANKS